MIKNYLLTALRSIAKRKGFTLLNVFGLAIGLAASLFPLTNPVKSLRYE